MEDPFAESPKDLADLERRFTEAVARLQAQHVTEVQRLQAQHSQAIAELTERYEKRRAETAANLPPPKNKRWGFSGENDRDRTFPNRN